jgi:two-component sensor histidine kinase
MSINNTISRSLCKGHKLLKINSDIHELFGAELSSIFKNNFRQATKIGSIYGIGLIRDERIYGNILILMQHGSSQPDASLIEAYISQASVALEQRRAEAKTQASLKEKTVLLKEIHHRVKNNLQIISSLLALQANYISDLKLREMFLVSCDRIRSMAFVHEQLYQSGNFTKINFRKYLNNLIQRLICSYETDINIELEIEVEQIDLCIDVAIPCGLIVNELITNTIKHAFPPNFSRKALLAVSLKCTPSGQAELLISDNGIGLPCDFNFADTDSLGMKLVNILAREQLGGNVELLKKQGTAFKITFNKDMA